MKLKDKNNLHSAISTYNDIYVFGWHVENFWNLFFNDLIYHSFIGRVMVICLDCYAIYKLPVLLRMFDLKRLIILTLWVHATMSSFHLSAMRFLVLLHCICIIFSEHCIDLIQQFVATAKSTHKCTIIHKLSHYLLQSSNLQMVYVVLIERSMSLCVLTTFAHNLVPICHLSAWVIGIYYDKL